MRLPLVIFFFTLTVFGCLGLTLYPFPEAAAEVRAEEETGLSSGASTAYESARRRLNLQTELPETRTAPPRRARAGWQLPDNLARIVLYAALAVVLAVVVLYLKDYLAARRPRLAEPEAEEPADKAEAVTRMTQARDSADALAEAGDFTQAMHLLLLQSVTELRRRLDVAIASYLTSREILARMKLGAEARDALADIIRRVELVYFGRYQAKLEDYLACRESFERLKLKLGAGAGT